MAKRVIPTLFEARAADDTVRVWVPGCATGEEVYSLGILLREHMLSHPSSVRVQIFATDIDEAALSVARSGRYPATMMANMSTERLARFFVADGDAYAVSKELRELCIFSAHSLIRDAPFSRVDLISCRNLLIYLGGPLQEQVIPLFHYALRPGGFLFLGVSETVSRYTELFSPEDKGHRIFRRRSHETVALPIKPAAPGAPRPWPLVPPARRNAANGSELRLAADGFIAAQFSPPHLLVNAEGDVVYQSANLGKYLEPASGAPSHHLLSMARRGLRLDLRAALREATETQRPAIRPRVEVEFEDRR